MTHTACMIQAMNHNSFCLFKDKRLFFGLFDQKMKSNTQTNPKSPPEIRHLYNHHLYNHL